MVQWLKQLSYKHKRGSRDSISWVRWISRLFETGELWVGKTLTSLNLPETPLSEHRGGGDQCKRKRNFIFPAFCDALYMKGREKDTVQPVW